MIPVPRGLGVLVYSYPYVESSTSNATWAMSFISHDIQIQNLFKLMPQNSIFIHDRTHSPTNTTMSRSACHMCQVQAALWI